MRHIVLSLVFTVGCLQVGWDDVPTAKVRADVTTVLAENPWLDNRAYWRAQLTTAVVAWNTAMTEVGCMPPFEVSDEHDAHSVLLVPWADWSHRDDAIGKWSSDGWIHVRDRRSWESNIPTLVHELGHAAGLTHDEDPTSALTAEVGELVAPGARDVARLRDLLGC